MPSFICTPSYRCHSSLMLTLVTRGHDDVSRGDIRVLRGLPQIGDYLFLWYNMSTCLQVATPFHPTISDTLPLGMEVWAAFGGVWCHGGREEIKTVSNQGYVSQEISVLVLFERFEVFIL